MQTAYLLLPTRPGSAALVFCSLALAGCSFMKTQMAISALDICLDKQCQAEQGAAREACSRSCYNQYGP